MATADLPLTHEQVAKIRWFHSIDLGNGIVTPGVVDSQKSLKRVAMPEDLTGRSVLDIGAWDGFYSFEAERRGAKRVLATDHHCWTGNGWGDKRGFDLTHRMLKSKVESQDIDVEAIGADTVGTFDVVFFLGVLYHLRNPMMVLERVAEVTDDLLILETAADLTLLRRPALAFYPGREMGDDASNWFGPNEAAVHAMLKAVGFRQVQTVYRPGFRLALNRLSRVLRRKPERGRLVVHARK